MAEEMRWYIVQAYSTFESKVAESIKEAAAKKGMEKYFEQVLVPKEEVVDFKKGKKVTSEKNFFPGYVLVKMILNDDTWHLVRSVPKVSTFLGARGKPQPIAEAEAMRILNQMEEGVSKPKSMVTYSVGDAVRVCDGPFNSFNGVVENVDEEKSRLKVAVSIFGRATQVDLEYSQVEKI
jgi:transcriptional antiterminator NusG